MKDHKTCQSCAMPIESGVYCRYCTDDDGNLHSFSERVARMTQFMKRESPDLSEEDALKKSLEYMSRMPAWRNHPKLLKKLNSH